jgi:mycothiol synthase
MRDLPVGYRSRRPRADEAPAIDRLGAASDASLGAAATLSVDLLRRMWARPGFSLEADAWAIDHGRDLVGYAQVWAEDATHLSGFAIVHPAHTGRGLGTALTAQIEERGAELASGTARLHDATVPEDAAAGALLTERGYRFVRRFWHMEVKTGDATPEAALPSPRITIRAIDPSGELATVHRVLEAAMADHWDVRPTSYEDFLDENVRQDDYDPDLWFLAFEGDEPVGALVGNLHGHRGSIDLIGVLRSHRGRGVASGLLRTSFAEHHRRGATAVRLSVDSTNPTGAVRLYQRAGMRVAASYDLWERSIQGRVDIVGLRRGIRLRT